MPLALDIADRLSRILPAFGAAAVATAGLSVLSWASLQPRPAAPVPEALLAPQPSTFAVQAAPESLPPARAAVAADPAKAASAHPMRRQRLAAMAPRPALQEAVAEPASIPVPPPTPAPAAPAQELHLVLPRTDGFLPQSAPPPPPPGDAPIPSHTPG